MQKILNYGRASAITDTLGGELISYKKDGFEYIWNGDAAYWTGHAPVLFPIVGVLKDEKVRIEAREYSMGRHGFARKSEFMLTQLTDNKAVFTLVSNPATKAQYPYDFKLTITHEITDKGFITEYKVKNTDDKAIQFTIGGHAGFCTPNSIEDYKLIFEQKEDSKIYYTNPNSYSDDSLIHEKTLAETNEFELCYEDFDNDAIIMKDLKSKKVKLVNKENGKGIEYDYEGFEVLAIWTPPKKRAPFICLEPWNGVPAYSDESGEFGDKPYIITLEPGKIYKAGYKIKLI